MRADPRIMARARALDRAARASSGKGKRRPVVVTVARMRPMIASTQDPELLELGLGNVVEMDYPGLGLALPSFATGLVSAAAKPLTNVASTLSFGLIKKSKDDGRLRANAEAYNLAISGNPPYQGAPSALAFLLLKSPKSKGGQGGWATSKAQNDAWTKYQQAKAVIAGQAPAKPAAVPVPKPSTPILLAPGGQTVPGATTPQQILQQIAQDTLQSAGVLPPAPTYTPGFGPDLPGYQPLPADGTDTDRNANLGLILGVAGGAALLATLASRRGR